MTWSSAGHCALIVQDLAELLERRDEDRLRAGVLQERRDLLRRKRRVDRHGPRSGAEDGVVRHRPLRPVLREDRDAVAGLDAERVQARARARGPCSRSPRAEIGFQAPPTFEIRRSGLPDAAADRKMSQSVRSSVLMSSLRVAVDCVAPLRGRSRFVLPRRAGAASRYRHLARWRSRCSLATLLALAGFLADLRPGLRPRLGPASAAPAARPLVTRHVGFAIPAVLFSLFSQSMVIFYFIGTGRLVKDEVASYPEPERRAVLMLSAVSRRDVAPRDLRPALRDRRLRPGRRRAHARPSLLDPPRGLARRRGDPRWALACRVDDLRREPQVDERSSRLRSGNQSIT